MEQQELIEEIKRTRLHQALANYASQHTRTEADLDRALELLRPSTYFSKTQDNETALLTTMKSITSW